MIEIAIPGGEVLRLNHLVLDYNGTLAADGTLLPGVAERLLALAKRVMVQVITADTHGTVAAQLASLPCALQIIDAGAQDQAKAALVSSLGRETVVAIGNGRNDCLMLKEAVLGIAVIQVEGASPLALLSADVVCRDITSALDLLSIPARLQATLRN